MDNLIVHTGNALLEGANGTMNIPYTINLYCNNKLPDDIDWDIVYKLDDAAQDIQHQIYMAAMIKGLDVVIADGPTPIARHSRADKEVILGFRTDRGRIYNARISTEALSASVHVLTPLEVREYTLQMAV